MSSLKFQDLVIVTTMRLTSPADIVLIRATVTFNAVLEVTNTLFNMFPPDLVGRMLMTTIAGIATVIIAFMAGHTFDVVIPIQRKIFVMIKGCGYPFLLVMALAAIASDLIV